MVRSLGRKPWPRSGTLWPFVPRQSSGRRGAHLHHEVRAAWAKDTADQTQSKEFSKLLKALGFNGRSGLGFYTLRRTFRIVADEAKDQPTADYIMEHESGRMSSVYRKTISDERLKAVSDFVRKWVFGKKERWVRCAADRSAQRTHPNGVTRDLPVDHSRTPNLLASTTG
ncbi:s-layer protein : Tyrosine recombinase XerC OS=Rhodopirellula baltica SH28 GN=RBSH_02353 PE=4 SV=1 [Gemmata massiliana]|uniref:S-layer protein: Tyrosine recombinase XerC n=1 Tax=Gemmata massiliana TaxID=1210884 RepID=A0A6P2D128_9BACT|nr:hypothetical protein [Gemmata massiliana]VTR94065.1 s-layer protein : Tyrosine recombinase XerC OS=Rhodopirellula baltica SH28 GN=RBSH_02353 PE=4 SV=1 [Gemmata massiliana]